MSWLSVIALKTIKPATKVIKEANSITKLIDTYHPN
jgi:hypothetical protein